VKPNGVGRHDPSAFPWVVREALLCAGGSQPPCRRTGRRLRREPAGKFARRRDRRLQLTGARRPTRGRKQPRTGVSG
jgi:hypothetical protein